MEKERLWVVWETNDISVINRIRKRFGIPIYTTIGKMSPAEISIEDLPVLQETAKRGYISVRYEGWVQKNGIYSFISRK